MYLQWSQFSCPKSPWRPALHASGFFVPESNCDADEINLWVGGDFFEDHDYKLCEFSCENMFSPSVCVCGVVYFKKLSEHFHNQLPAVSHHSCDFSDYLPNLFNNFFLSKSKKCPVRNTHTLENTHSIHGFAQQSNETCVEVKNKPECFQLCFFKRCRLLALTVWD